MTTEPTIQINDVKETISQFMDKISVAQMNRDEWVETTPEIIKHYNRNGMNGAKFFIFQGIKVCEHGQAEKIEEENNIPAEQRIFKEAAQGTVEGQ